MSARTSSLFFIALLLWAACAPDATETSSAVAYLAQAAGSGATAPRADGVVQTRAGQVRGTQAGASRSFLGIPYAEPPVGALRFAAPQPSAPWQGVRDATRFGKSCMQASGVVSPMDMSEDCLTLNVFAPAAAPAAPLPVMVFIHGGAFLAGGSSTYDATALREAGNVIVVTLNYRLGPFGFLAHPALCAADAPCSNQGLRDQQLALTWVRDNIAEFGGDPLQVTVFGESAGAVSACAHMFANGSQGLAQHFILQSGACAYGPLGIQSEALALAAGQTVVNQLCPAAREPSACLRAASATELAAVLVDTADPIVDGYWPWLDHALFEAPLEALAERQAMAPGAVIVGTNQNEWLLWQALGVTQAPFGNLALRDSIARFFPRDAQRIAEHYTPSNPFETGDAFVRLMTDAYFRCPARALARGLGTRGDEVYTYEFTVQPAAHALEVDYVFNLLAVSLLFPFEAPSPLLPQVVNAMQGYWTQLAATGDPNRVGLPHWPSYAAAHEHMIFGDAVRVDKDLSEADCGLWDALRMH
jgi:para-nitrobenzyl esterase